MGAFLATYGKPLGLGVGLAVAWWYPAPAAVSDAAAATEPRKPRWAGVRTLPTAVRGRVTTVSAAAGLERPLFVLPNGAGVGYGLFVLDDASRHGTRQQCPLRSAAHGVFHTPTF